MNENRHAMKRHPIRVVASRTGLSRDVLRAWEHRYGAVVPERALGGQRLYSNEDIERLRLMNRARTAGRRIGQVARLSLEELARLVEEDEQMARVAAGAPEAGPPRAVPEPFLAEALAAVERMDAGTLEAVLSRAALALDAADLIDRVVAPLMIEIGERWWQGELLPGHERIATVVVRRMLDRIRINARNEFGPALVVATPSGQHHEIGAMLAAAAAATEDWRVTYMGADLPASSIAVAVEATGAQAVALSLIYPPDDPQVSEALRELKALLADYVSVIIGGQAAPSYRSVIEEIGALWLANAPARGVLDLLNAIRGNGKR
jgi:DNA-binding transcriptional MerR regulator/methylmalonyl-CoA mutase cobalamin-binding subunit